MTHQLTMSGDDWLSDRDINVTFKIADGTCWQERGPNVELNGLRRKEDR